MKSKQTRLTEIKMQLKLEQLLYEFDETYSPSSIEDSIDHLRFCIISMKHDLESTQRERDFLIGELGK